MPGNIIHGCTFIISLGYKANSSLCFLYDDTAKTLSFNEGPVHTNFLFFFVHTDKNRGFRKREPKSILLKTEVYRFGVDGKKAKRSEKSLAT